MEKNKKETISNTLDQATKELIEFRRKFLRAVPVQGKIRLSQAGVLNTPKELQDVTGDLTLQWMGQVCHCHFVSSIGKTCTWTIDSLSPTAKGYEDLLFKAWPDVGRDKWQWRIGSERHSGLETIARLTQKKLTPLLQYQNYKELAEEAIQTIRDGKPKWKPCTVQWTYLEKLGDVIQNFEIELESVKSEADDC
jgi:hypothetical protein